MPPCPSPFLRLPAEIRLMVYELLLLPPAANSPPPRRDARTIAPDYYDYEAGSNANSLSAPRTLQIRTMDPTTRALHLPPNSSRSTYHVRSGRFRARTMTTTYALQHNPGLHTAILATCRQCHAEAAEFLYSSYCFDFDTHIEAIVPFLSDMTPLARSCITRVAMVKRALPYVKEFDRAEWATACEYMARQLNVAALMLSLGVVAGKPAGANGWDDVPALTVEHFRLVQPRDVESRPPSGTATPVEPDDTAVVSSSPAATVLRQDALYGLGLKAIAGVDFEWVEQLMGMRGIRDMHVRAIVEHCPPPVSDTMAFWVSFSKSVEGAFREWVRGVMLK